MKQKKIKTVVVLGMHRSGTSMTTGILNKLGVNVGERLLRQDVANPLGYFEDIDFFKLNNKILRAAGGNWKTPPKRDSILVQKDKFKKQINDLVSRKESELWGWKDPRTNLTIELYLPYLTNPHFIVCHREPKAVAKSLAQRENWKIQNGIRLIKIYEERINTFFKKYNNLQRIDLNYENATSNSEEAIDNIIRFLGIQVSKKKYQEALKMILTPKEIQVLKSKTKKRLEVNNSLFWGDL